MRDVYRSVVADASAWTNASLGGESGIAIDLRDAHLAALDQALAKTRHLKPQEATHEQFDQPVLRNCFAQLKENIMNGRGAVLVRGITPQRYSEEDFERIFWGVGTHLGIAAVQSPRGDRVGHVRHDPQSGTNRGYRGNSELTPHTDAYEIAGLMSVQIAQSGGYSQLASAADAHNYILQTRPELLDTLYRGFPYLSNEAAAKGREPTPYAVPIFSCIDGRISISYVHSFMTQAAQRLGMPMPPQLVEALDYLDRYLQRDDVRLNFMLQPGEMIIWNNLTVMHARTAFQNSDTQQRHLLRLWLDVPNGHPMIPEFAERVKTFSGQF